MAIASASRILRRQERIEIERAHLVERRLLDGADERRQIQVLPSRHARSMIVESRMCSRLCNASASRPSSASRPDTTVATRSRSALASAITASDGAPNERSTDKGQTGVGARRVDREIDGVAKLRDAFSGLVPIRQAFLPFLGSLRGIAGSGEPLASGLRTIDPRFEIRRRELRERQQQIGKVTLGIDTDRGMPSIAASSRSARHSPVLPLPVIPTHTA